MQLIWTKHTAADLKSIFMYISKDSPDMALSVLSAIRTTVRMQLPLFPHSGRDGRVTGTRELLVPKYHYIVVYKISTDNIEILRIIHPRRLYPTSLS